MVTGDQPHHEVLLRLQLGEAVERTGVLTHRNISQAQQRAAVRHLPQVGDGPESVGLRMQRNRKV